MWLPRGAGIGEAIGGTARRARGARRHHGGRRDLLEAISTTSDPPDGGLRPPTSPTARLYRVPPSDRKRVVRLDVAIFNAGGSRGSLSFTKTTTADDDPDYFARLRDRAVLPGMLELKGTHRRRRSLRLSTFGVAGRTGLKGGRDYLMAACGSNWRRASRSR